MNNCPQSTYHVSQALFVLLPVLLCSHTSLLRAEDAIEHPNLSSQHLCVHLCICLACVHTCVCMCMYVHPCGGQRLTQSVFLNHFIVRRGSLNLEFFRSPRDPPVPGFPVLGLWVQCYHSWFFNVDAGDWIQVLILVGNHLTLDSSS